MDEAYVYLGIAFKDPKRFKSLIKVIIENVLPYIDNLNIAENVLVKKIKKAIEEHILLDKIGDIKGVYFQYNTKIREKANKSLDFLT